MTYLQLSFSSTIHKITCVGVLGTFCGQTKVTRAVSEICMFLVDHLKISLLFSFLLTNPIVPKKSSIH